MRAPERTIAGLIRVSQLLFAAACGGFLAAYCASTVTDNLAVMLMSVVGGAIGGWFAGLANEAVVQMWIDAHPRAGSGMPPWFQKLMIWVGIEPR